MTLTVSRGDEATRSEFTEVSGNLVANWTAGDKLLVFDYSGNKLGYLSLKENASGVYTNTETFSGTVTLSDNSKGVGIAYLGASRNNEVASYNNNFYEYNLANQDGSFASMAANDCLAAEGEATIGNDGVATVASLEGGNIVMERRIAFGHFKINGTDAPTLKAGDKIVISADKMANTAKIYLNNGGSINTPGTSSKYYGDITIKLTQDPANNDFYVTMVPYGNAAKFNPTFTVKTSDGKTYSSEALGDHTWKYGEYVHSGVNGAPKEVTVTPDDDGSIKWVDLGLSVLWADRNIGATTPEDAGGYYSFAGLTSMTVNPDYTYVYDYSEMYYSPGTVGYNILKNLKTIGCLEGSSNYFYEMERLKGTEYDVVSVTYNDAEYYTADTFAWIELVNNCTFTKTIQNNVSGWLATAKNGNSIFFPATGIYNGNNKLLSSNVIMRTDVISLGGDSSNSGFYVNFASGWNKRVSSIGINGSWNMFAPVRGVKSK